MSRQGGHKRRMWQGFRYGLFGGGEIWKYKHGPATKPQYVARCPKCGTETWHTRPRPIHHLCYKSGRTLRLIPVLPHELGSD